MRAKDHISINLDYNNSTLFPLVPFMVCMRKGMKNLRLVKIGAAATPAQDLLKLFWFK